MANIKQVAELAGVSTATISKYLNGVKLKEKNRIAVESAIKELDYKINSIARGLRTNKTMTIGILIHELDNLFATSIVSVIEDILMNEGYSTIICDYKSNEEIEIQKLNFLKDKMVDGIIYVPTHLTKENLDEIDIPIVFIDRMIDGVTGSFVLVDNEFASYEAVTYLIENGHKNIGLLCGPESIYTFKERLNGYKKAMFDNNLELIDEYIHKGENDLKTGFNMTEKLLKSENSPTAIFTTSYELTLGSIVALNENNIIIPDDISFVGFDNLDIAKIVKPKLSIVTQPNEEIGKTAAQCLLQKLKGENIEPTVIKLKTNLIKQNSVINLK